MPEGPRTHETLTKFSLHDALILASELHEGQRAKDDRPYIEHPLRASKALNLEGYGEDVQMVALLHDVVEKTPATPDFLRENGVPEEVVQGVDSVTIPEGEDYFDAMERSKGNRLGRLVRLADNCDHITRITRSSMPEDDRKAQLEKYEKARAIIIEGDDELADPAPRLQAHIENLYDA